MDRIQRFQKIFLKTHSPHLSGTTTTLEEALSTKDTMHSCCNGIIVQNENTGLDELAEKPTASTKTRTIKAPEPRLFNSLDFIFM